MGAVVTPEATRSDSDLKMGEWGSRFEMGVGVRRLGGLVFYFLSCWNLIWESCEMSVYLDATIGLRCCLSLSSCSRTWDFLFSP